MSHLRGRRLRDVVILAVQTPKVAACGGDGEARRAGMEVIERLLLNRVDGQRARVAISLADEHAAPIASAATQSHLAISYMAVVGAELTLHPRFI